MTAARLAGAIATALLLASVAWAEGEGQAQSQGNYYSTTTTPTPRNPGTGYQAPPVQVPSGTIIGYQPIPSNALEAAMSDALPAPTAARPAYSARPAYPAAPGAGVPGNAAGGNFYAGQTAPLQSQGPGIGGQPGLPASYLTGIVGEGFYTLGRDDVIHIDVRNQPEFSGAFVIGFDGKIQYNYLGDIPIAGLTKYEVQQVIEKLLQRYVRVPAVNVMIIGYNSKVVYVVGEVNHPGKFIMRGDAIKLREAILAAGLPTDDAALGRVHVIKPDLDRPKVKVINVKRILYAGKLKDDLELYSGEIVVIPSTTLSKVNRFLGRLLSPATKVGRAAAYAY